jgi:hypothetical protein
MRYLLRPCKVIELPFYQWVIVVFIDFIEDCIGDRDLGWFSDWLAGVWLKYTLEKQ